MLEIVLYILAILLLLPQSTHSFQVGDAGIRHDTPDGVDYEPDCIQKVYWWDPERKKIGGDASLVSNLSSTSFLKDETGLAVSRSDVPVEEIEASNDTGRLTFYFPSGEESFDVEIILFMLSDDGKIALQESSGLVSKDVVQKLLEQTEDVHIKVQGKLDSYEQVIPLEVIKEFSEFYSECLPLIKSE
jgi:hypothetical protein